MDERSTLAKRYVLSRIHGVPVVDVTILQFHIRKMGRDARRGAV
jgi:hypothetical protein